MTAEPDARRGGRDGADLRDRLRELVRRAEAGDLAAAEIPATALAEELAASWRGGLTLDAAAEGLLLAAHLLAHKADALVPRREEPVTPSAEPLPEEALAEPEPAVLERLAALEPFREAAAALREYEAARAARYARGRPQLPEASDAGGATAEQLLQALARIWARAAAAAPLVARRDAVTVRERVRVLEARLVAAGGTLSFFALFDEGASRLEIVVTFLALLELVRLGRVRVDQPEPFGEILIRLAGG